jgi:hypothetical protein
LQELARSAEDWAAMLTEQPQGIATDTTTNTLAFQHVSAGVPTLQQAIQ